MKERREQMILDMQNKAAVAQDDNNDDDEPLIEQVKVKK